MADYIDRQKAIVELRKEMYADKDYMSALICDGIEDVLKSLPSADVVEVVRCKDCKWCEAHYDTDGNAPYWICRNWDGGTDADGFCYEAERKTDG